jgi:hypothetical protein
MEGDTSVDYDRCDAWTPPVIADLPPTALSLPADAEARRDLRVEFPFAVLIRWQDRSGQRFEFSTVLDSLTPTEVELRLDRPILGNRRPLLVIRLAREAADPALRLAFLGTVQRIEPLPDGCWSHTITFTHYRFLYSAPTGPGTSAPGS